MSNLPAKQRTDWISREIVGPDDTNGWGSAINALSEAAPNYSANGSFYNATYSNNIYSLTPIDQNEAPKSYIEGMQATFKCPANNLADCSVNINSLGAKLIKTNYGTSLSANTLLDNTYVNLRYDNITDTFQVTNLQLTGAGSPQIPVYINALGKATPIDSYHGKVLQDIQGRQIDETYATLNDLKDTKAQIQYRNIGEIITSTLPLKDAGLHLLDGSLIYGGGVYDDFVNYIKQLYEENPPEKVPVYEDITLPTFTSNNQDGIDISDARNNTTVLQAIFNGTNSYNQIGTWSDYWININYNQPTYLTSYTIQADNYGGPEYPSAWTLKGSNDGETWTDIESQTGLTFKLNETKTFTVNSTKTYKQYRIVFSDGVLSKNEGELKKVSFNAKRFLYDNFINSYFTTQRQWDASIQKYGVCGKFVYDEDNNTIRLPKIMGFTEAITSINELGDIIPQDVLLPNIYGNVGTTIAGGRHDGAFYRSGNGGKATNQDKPDDQTYMDASRCSKVYSGSDDNIKIHPQSTGVLYYIVIAQQSSQKNLVQANVDNIVSDLNNKVDKDHPYIVSTYQNGNSWYRVYSDGWCEQGGQIATIIDTVSNPITFLVPYKDTTYTIIGETCSDNTTLNKCQPDRFSAKTNVGINVVCDCVDGMFQWVAMGYTN